ncbi:MAG: transglycosylase SLT domain-containing protein, partial [Streptomycetaceae bacterium]|nr:transglycosylase SLT domain-containing protein [Streptomycetaceae bacterium]
EEAARIQAEQKAAADKAAADKAAADKAAADKAAADKAAADKAAADRASRSDTRTPVGSASTGDPKAIARSMMSASQFQCFSNIVERESGWNYKATNPSSGAYGLVQALPGSKMASAGSDWRTNPETQIKWGLSYMNSRYGSPCGAWSFWQSHNWY